MFEPLPLGRSERAQIEAELAQRRYMLVDPNNRLAAPDLIDRRAHVVVDAPPRHAAEHTEGVVVGVEQHLVRLLRISSRRLDVS